MVWRGMLQRQFAEEKRTVAIRSCGVAIPKSWMPARFAATSSGFFVHFAMDCASASAARTSEERRVTDRAGVARVPVGVVVVRAAARAGSRSRSFISAVCWVDVDFWSARGLAAPR